MSRTPATLFVGRASVVSSALVLALACAENASVLPSAALEATEIERLTDVRRDAIAALPAYASASFVFAHARAAEGRTVVRLTEDEPTLTFTGAVDALNEVVHGEIPFQADDGLRWARGGFSGWLRPSSSAYVRGVTVGGAERSWTVSRYAVESDGLGLFVLTVDLTGRDGPDRMVAYGRLVGRCEVVDETSTVRRVVRPAPGSLCDELVGWL